jgi:hypothetical protein
MLKNLARFAVTVVEPLALVAFLAAALHAQADGPPHTHWHPANWKPVAGWHFGSPAKISAALGFGRVLRRDTAYTGDSLHRRTFLQDRSLFAVVEPGLKGSRASLGYSVDRSNRNGISLWSLRATAYRRWNSDHADPGGAYAGLEASAMAMADIALGLRVGLLTRVSGPSGARRTLATIDFPIGW